MIAALPMPWRAVDDILGSVDQWNVARQADGKSPIEIGIAVTEGRVVFGAVGGDSRLEYAVVGHPVNLSAKIEKLNKEEGTRALCTIEAYQAALAQGYRTVATVEQLTQRTVPGVSGALDLVVLAR